MCLISGISVFFSAKVDVFLFPLRDKLILTTFTVDFIKEWAALGKRSGTSSAWEAGNTRIALDQTASPVQVSGKPPVLINRFTPILIALA